MHMGLIAAIIAANAAAMKNQRERDEQNRRKREQEDKLSKAYNDKNTKKEE